MNTLIYAAGSAVVLLLAGAVGWLLVEIAVGFANAVSYCRFNLASMRLHGRTPRWRRLPASFCRLWVEYIGYRNRGAYQVTTGSGDVWRGIGDWTLCPPAQWVQDAPPP